MKNVSFVKGVPDFENPENIPTLCFGWFDGLCLFFSLENNKFLHLYRVMIWLESQLHFLYVLKEVKHQARRELLASAGDDIIKAVVECAINTLNGNRKLTKTKTASCRNIKIGYVS